MVLDKIQKENDIKKLSEEELEILPGEIRKFLLEKVSVTGGHLASNLGVVELTMAMHLVFDLPKDKLIWDVGHQSYTHKLLTGRREGFEDLRKFGGMSGFPKRKESPCDAFDTGHSSTSISAGLGYVHARDIKGEDYHVVSVIGDGAMTGGMAYEALNNAASLKTNFIMILNDNHMSISENVGGMSAYLARLRTADIYTGLKKGVTSALHTVPLVGDHMISQIRKTKSSIKQLVVPGMFFEDMGITYLGPIPGHNLSLLCRALREAARVDGPVLVHVMTQKGKGYGPAEEQPDKFHGVGPFQVQTGEIKEEKKKDTYTDVFGKVLCDCAAKNDKIAAMGIVLKVSMIALLILTGFAFGAQPLFGYYFGSGDRKKLRALLRFTLLFILAAACLLTVSIIIFSSSLMKVFVDDSGMIAEGSLMLRLQVVTMPLVGLILLLMIIFQSAGKALGSFILSISRQGIIFFLVLAILCRAAGYTGIILSQAAADIITAVIAAILFRLQIMKEFR